MAGYILRKTYITPRLSFFLVVFENLHAGDLLCGFDDVELMATCGREIGS
jgi:hypothetical protein